MFEYLVKKLQRRQTKVKCMGLPSNGLLEQSQGDVWGKAEAHSWVRWDISTCDLIAFQTQDL